MSYLMPNDPGRRAAGTAVSVRWRSSRHARRLLTLGLFGVFIATITRRPEFAGLAAPALLLLAAGRIQRRPPRDLHLRLPKPGHCYSHCLLLRRATWWVRLGSYAACRPVPVVQPWSEEGRVTPFPKGI